jgi:hypothetical protein
MPLIRISPSEESQSTESTGLTSLLSTSEESARSIAFTTIDNLHYELENLSGDALYITGIYLIKLLLYFISTNLSIEFPEEELQTILQPDTRRFRIRSYSAASQLLILIMPTGPHESPHRFLSYVVAKRFEDMGLGPLDHIPCNWKEMGAKTFQISQFCKESDSAGGPRLRPPGVGDKVWPTLIIEAGYSETLPQLRIDKDRWFSYSEFDVKVVLLVKLENQSKTIIIEHWEKDPARTITTRSQARSTIRVNTITIRNIPLSDLTQETSYIIDPPGAQLQLSFTNLFLRSIQPPRESDVIITAPELELMARGVWEETG